MSGSNSKVVGWLIYCLMLFTPLLLQSDFGNQLVRAIAISNGNVSTLAGTAGVTGYANGVGLAATFYNPWGVATDGSYAIIVSFTRS